jgi:hypothetical protein
MPITDGELTFRARKWLQNATDGDKPLPSAISADGSAALCGLWPNVDMHGCHYFPGTLRHGLSLWAVC